MISKSLVNEEFLIVFGQQVVVVEMETHLWALLSKRAKHEYMHNKAQQIILTTIHNYIDFILVCFID